MTTLSVGGKGHRILTDLINTPAPAHVLTGIATEDGNQKARSKAWRVLGAIKDLGLIISVAGDYRITDEGRAALETLDRGKPCELGRGRPSVRVFERRAA